MRRTAKRGFMYSISKALGRTGEAAFEKAMGGVACRQGAEDGGALAEWKRLGDVSEWADKRLIAAIRRDPPDEEALDELANRYWKGLYGRCFMLTLDSEKASDLAQEAWCRVLRRRDNLKADGNFPAYIATVATNLWRDWRRSEKRAGPMALCRLESLDASNSEEDDSLNLLNCLPDLQCRTSTGQALLAIDIDNSLRHLTPRLREVLIARYISGESCAEIGQRCGRTEQSVSGWVRQGLREMKVHLQSRGMVDPMTLKAKATRIFPDGSACRELSPLQREGVWRLSFLESNA
jgi:RNA polymerase sigma factor (sigma-70 family)